MEFFVTDLVIHPFTLLLEYTQIIVYLSVNYNTIKFNIKRKSANIKFMLTDF